MPDNTAPFAVAKTTLAWLTHDQVRYMLLRASEVLDLRAAAGLPATMTLEEAVTAGLVTRAEAQQAMGQLERPMADNGAERPR